MSCKAIRNQQGATLVESLVAAALFALVAAAIGQLLVQHTRMQVTNGTTTTAIALASKELEDLRALDYPSMASRSSAVVVSATSYAVNTTVVADSPRPNLKSITASVTWTEPLGPKAYSLYAVFTNIKR